MEIFNIDGDYITLGELLKALGIAGTGGEAKFIITDGRVRVNGHIIKQRGKKILPGDIIEVDGKREISIGI